VCFAVTEDSQFKSNISTSRKGILNLNIYLFQIRHAIYLFNISESKSKFFTVYSKCETKSTKYHIANSQFM